MATDVVPTLLVSKKGPGVGSFVHLARSKGKGVSD